MSHSLRLQELRSSLVQPVSLDLEAGDCLALHGPSGAGKSLLMRAIADLDVCEGEVWLDQQPRSGMSPSQWRRRVAYLPAESHRWEESVAAHAGQWDLEILRQLGIEEAVLGWQTARLSSGEKQRLALARALTNQPHALLLDEPTANLDARNSRLVEEVIQHYKEARQVPVIWVSHDPEQRQRVADRSATIDGGRLTWN